MDLALTITQRPSIHCATLIVLNHGMSHERIAHEWQAARDALRSELGDRLELIALGRTSDTVIPEGQPKLVALASNLRKLTARERRTTRRPEVHYTVVKLLLLRWLLGEGPVTTTRLTELAGCSYPTAAKSLKRLERHILRQSDRRVELRAWPRDVWEELIVMSPRIRNTVHFADRSGEPTNPAKLLERLTKLRTPAAVGGVVAARHWDPEFDLHGTPRLDLSIHAPDGDPDLGFIEKLDPALQSTTEVDEPISVAVHAVHRAEHLFARDPNGQLDLADPVETLLDLHELRLVQQADDMARRLFARMADELPDVPART